MEENIVAHKWEVVPAGFKVKIRQENQSSRGTRKDRACGK
jgi:hypothetical protein